MAFTDDELKEYMNEKGVTVASTARKLILNANDVEAAADKVAEELSARVVVTRKDVVQLLGDKVAKLDEESDTDESTESESDEDESTSDDEEGDDDSYREKIRDEHITRVTTETAKNVEDFGEVSEDPWDDIVEIDSGVYNTERSTENREYTVPDAVADRSESQGEKEDFAAYFRSRYRKISNLLEQRVSARKIGTLDSRVSSDAVTVIGIVDEVRDTKKGNKRVVVEDTTGMISAVYTDDEEIEKCEQVVQDEVVALQGNLSDNNEIIFGDRILFPDIPPRRKPNTADRSVKAALISDLHFGAREMAADKWNKFVDWIHQQDDIEYLLIAGDVIEGVGIYSGQKEQLSVPTIKKQYELCQLALEQLPDDIEIIITPGNHDGIPQAEPQPSFPEKYTSGFPDNVKFSGNPATVTIEGVKILMYHGVSILPFVDSHGGDVQTPADGMWPMLQKRHMAPMYGEGVRILPEREDHLVIEEVPDIIHSGHVHTVDIDSYKGVKVLNTGAWQHQTDYQKRLDIEPDVGYCFLVDLESLNVRPYGF